MRLEDSAGGWSTGKVRSTTKSTRETEKIRGNQGNVHEDFGVLKVSTMITIYMTDYPSLSIVRLQYMETNEVGFFGAVYKTNFKKIFILVQRYVLMFISKPTGSRKLRK